MDNVYYERGPLYNFIMKITTKMGDKGETSLFGHPPQAGAGGRRVSKASRIIDVIGELDELQAVVGWCRVGAKAVAGADKVSPPCPPLAWVTLFDRVVDDIYRMMSIVGFEFKCPKNIKPIGEQDVEFLEKEMSKYEKIVGDLNKFVRPGGSEISARLHIARTVCRRVERGMVGLIENLGNGKGKGPACGGLVLKYLNRLSDLLFVMTVTADQLLGK